MDEYRLDVKVRNNIILYKIEKAGYKTLGEFCRINNIMKYVSQLGSIISMKESPLQSDGEFRKCIIYIADLLGCAPIDFFTDTQLHTVLKTNKRSMQVSEAEMKFMLENHTQSNKLLEHVIQDEQKNEAIEEVLKTLPNRHKKIIEMRLGLGDFTREHTLEEVAQEIGVTRERIRQMEAKAYRIMRHPSKADKLKEFLNE